MIKILEYVLKLSFLNKKKEQDKKQVPFIAELTGDNDTEPYIDTNSPTWRYIEKYVKSELSGARVSNDSPNRDIVKTSLLRGRIAVCKDILALPGRAGDAMKIFNSTIVMLEKE
jgi:hypothetical protein